MEARGPGGGGGARSAGSSELLRRLADPGSNFTSYKAVAESYARVEAALPLPPDGESELLVQIGNELNLAW